MKKASFLQSLLVGLFVVAPLTGVLAQNGSPSADLKRTILEAKAEAPVLAALKNTLGTGELGKTELSEAELYCVSIACKQLAIYGSDPAVETLEPLLADARLSQYARLALEAIPSETAPEALLRGAKDLTGTLRANCIDSLGVLKYRPAVGEIVQIANTDDDPMVQKAAWEALGRLGTDDALNALIAQNPNERTADALAAGLLNAADLCLATGKTEQAKEIYRKLNNRAFPNSARRAGAYRGWLVQDSETVVETLVLAVSSEDPNEYEPALKAIRERKSGTDKTLVDAILNRFAEWNFARQTLVAAALMDRQDKASSQAAFPIVEQWAQSGLAEQVLAALKILKNAKQLDPNKTWPLLESILNKTADKSVQIAVIAIALGTPGQEIENQIVDFIARCKPDEFQTVRLILNQRYVPAAAPALLKRAPEDGLTFEQRNAALSALAAAVDLDAFPDFLTALDKMANEAQRQAFLQKACVHLPQQESARTIVRLMQSGETKDRIALLPILKIIGGPDALEELGKRCADPETIDVATQILGSWNDPETIAQCAEICMNVAKSQVDEKYQIRALRGYIRVPRQFNLPAADKIEMCARFFDNAKRDADRLLVFDVLRRIIAPESAEAAFAFANAEFSREPACECVLTIAREIKEKDARIAAVLKNVAETSKKKETVENAKELSEKLR